MSPIRPLALSFAFVFSVVASAATTQPTTRPIRVAVYDDAGASPAKLVAMLEKEPTLQVVRVNAEQVRAGALDQVDVVLHAGGSGGGQGKQLAEEGRQRVRAFVQRGGGYVGICAGAYLATCDYPWSLHILDAKVIDKQHWARGTDRVDVGFSEVGRQRLAAPADACPILYFQGPLLAPAGNPELADYETLGTYNGEVAQKGAPKGVMKGTTAIAAAAFGDGRVLCFSPHPEKTPGLEYMILRAITWTARK